jgi:hypothetical protein
MREGDSLEDLPAPIRDEIFRRTLEVAKVTREVQLRDLRCCQDDQGAGRPLNPPAGATVIMESRLLAITDANMHARMIADDNSNASASINSGVIGKQAPLKTT